MMFTFPAVPQFSAAYTDHGIMIPNSCSISSDFPGPPPSDNPIRRNNVSHSHSKISMNMKKNDLSVFDDLLSFQKSCEKKESGQSNFVNKTKVDFIFKKIANGNDPFADLLK